MKKVENYKIVLQSLIFPRYGRFTFCPYCSCRITQPRNGDDFCEDCGWPDEVRTEEG